MSQESEKVIGSAQAAPTSESGRTYSVEGLQQKIKTWADGIYPDRTSAGALVKMVMEEIPELLNGGLDDPLEWADVLILLIDASALRGIDIVRAAWEKMDINEKRFWAIDPDTGLLHHV